MFFKSALFSLLALASCQPESNTVSPSKSIETWIFCGIHPNDKFAQTKANTMAKVAGIDVSMGPCMPPDSNYTTSNPGSRYVDPQTYLHATVINANAGIKTVVYDARIWNDDPAVRQQAIDFWMPHLAWIRAWDMGDEFDPGTNDWQILVHRWNIVLTHIVPVTNVGPFTNHLGSVSTIEQALIDLPNQGSHLSYDAYTETNGKMQASLDIARTFDSQVNHLMCAINALQHNSFRPTATKIKNHIKDHINAGCDSILIFGGDMPINTPGFSKPSLVNSKGKPTSLASAIFVATNN